jgi:hypothetical protein
MAGRGAAKKRDQKGAGCAPRNPGGGELSRRRSTLDRRRGARSELLRASDRSATKRG